MSSSKALSRVYNPEPTALAFHLARDKYPVRFIRGVPGTGKSVAALLECFIWGITQEPFEQVRRTRFAVVRATYPALKSTTIKSWEQWFSPKVWPVKSTYPMTCLVEFELEDKTWVHMEMIFIAVESEDDADKLKSFELTGAFGNEAFQFDRKIVTTLLERVGRYPSIIEGGPTRSGVWFDTNSPSERHWWAQAERDPPEGWAFFVQPAPLIRVRDDDGNTIGWEDNPKAENIKNLTGGYDYYRRQLPGLTEEEKKVNIENKFGSIFEGKPVYINEFKESMLSVNPLFVDPTAQVLIGIDTSGLNPAAVFGQTSFGRLALLQEILALDTTFDVFVDDLLLPMIKKHFPTNPILCIVDPSNPRDAKSGQTPIQGLAAAKLVAVPAPTNKPVLRIRALKHFMTRQDAFLVDPSMGYFRDGLLGGYAFPKIKGSDGLYGSVPLKNEFAHVIEAGQYLATYLRKVNAIDPVMDEAAAQFKASRAGGGRRTQYRYT